MTESKKYQGEVMIVDAHSDMRPEAGVYVVGRDGRALGLNCRRGRSGPHAFASLDEARDFAEGHGLIVVERFSPEPTPEPAPMLVRLVRLPGTRPSRSRGRNWAFARGDMYVTDTLKLTFFAELAACFEWRDQAEEWACEKGLAVEGLGLILRDGRRPTPAAKNPLSVYQLYPRPGLMVAHMTPAQAERLALLLGADGVEVQP